MIRKIDVNNYEILPSNKGLSIGNVIKEVDNNWVFWVSAYRPSINSIIAEEISTLLVELNGGMNEKIIFND